MKIDMKYVKTNVWFSDISKVWKWVIYIDVDTLESVHMQSGYAPSKEKAEEDILKTIQWIEENY